MGLSREVLRWILSLDLSLSVRNPRRDFSNGYLVAEILSRYWDDISMHSYVNATSTAEKRSNWDLLTKFFHVHGINLTSDTVDAIISQQQAAVDKFLQQLYLFVNERSPAQASTERHHPPASAMLPGSSSCTSRQSSMASTHSPWAGGVADSSRPAQMPSPSQIHAMMQQQLAQMAPIQQQDIIASVMAQRAVFVQALMAGKNPEEAMAAAIEQIPNHGQPVKAANESHDGVCGPQSAQRHPNISLSGRSASPTRPYSAGRLRLEGQTAAWEQESTMEHGRTHARDPKAAKSRAASNRETRSTPHSPPRRDRSQPQRSPTEFETRTVQDWKDNANNPKADTYRYWELGSLGPAETEELASKRLAALRAKEYGIRVAEMAKTTLKPKPKQDSSHTPSTRDRAKEFAKTVRAPKRSSKAPAVAPKAQGSAGGSATRGRVPPTQNAAATDTGVPHLETQVSVNAMVERHMDAARRVADIKAEVERWDLEDRQLPEVPELPKRRSPSPPRGRTQRRSPSPVREKPAAPAGRGTVPKKKAAKPARAAEKPTEQPERGREVPVERPGPVEQDAGGSAEAADDYVAESPGDVAEQGKADASSEDGSHT